MNKGGMNISTRSRIGIIRKDGTIKSIYCHHDGYLEYVGKILNDYYSNYDDIKELINLGDISSLREKVKPYNDLDHSFDEPQEDVTIAYHRDRDEEWKYTKPNINKNIDDFNKGLEDSWIEYIYLYDEKNKKWLWDSVDYTKNEINLKQLSNAFKEKIALKSGYYFMIFEKDKVPFFDDLKRLDRQVEMDNNVYELYEASDWDTAKKVDNIMGNNNLGFDVDEYEINKNINI